LRPDYSCFVVLLLMIERIICKTNSTTNGMSRLSWMLKDRFLSKSPKVMDSII
jgi:hypothetical protein